MSDNKKLEMVQSFAIGVCAGSVVGAGAVLLLVLLIWKKQVKV